MTEDLMTILYIDDDQDDLMIFGEAMSSLQPGISVLKAQSGEEGIEILDNLEQESRPFPSLIVLDMNMPRMDGRQIMQKIKSKHNWKEIPVVIFTTSSNQSDVEFCKRYGTECITKPMSYNNLNNTIRQLLSHCKIHTPE
jgi:CheY-like chemotaxis protein